MKHLKLFESYFKSKEDWRIGDIVVATETKYSEDTHWLHENYKYKILEIGDKNTTIKVKEIGFPYSDVDEYVPGLGTVLGRYFSKDIFITLEEWELTQKRDKFNI